MRLALASPLVAPPAKPRGAASGCGPKVVQQAHRLAPAASAARSQRRRQWHTAASALGKEEAATEEEASVSGGTADVSLQPSTSYSSSSEGGEDDSRAFAVAMAQVAWETKAQDIVVLHVAPMVYWTRYMVLATVFSRPQLNAILGKMEKEAAEAHGRRLSASPAAGSGGWELLDYGDVVVHVLTAEQREYYDLEGFYGAAEEVALPFAEEEEGADVATWAKRL